MLDSIRGKLTLWHTGALALALIAFSLGVYALMTRKLHERLDTGLRTSLDGTVRLFVHEKEEGDPDDHAAGSAMRKYYYPRQAIAFFDGRGGLLREQLLGELRATLPAELAALDREGAQFFTHEAPGIEHGVRIAVQRIRTPGQGAVFLAISQPRDEMAEDLELLAGILGTAVPLALSLAAAGGWFLARKSLAPVSEMSEAARRIGAANLDQQLPVANPRDELGRLATTFNELLGRLHAAFSQQRQFMADASHELRTPLSVMNTAVQVTMESPSREEGEYRDALSLIGEQVRRLARIVDEMFTLARADAGRRELHQTSFYLDELLVEVMRAAVVLAQPKGIAVGIGPLSETPFYGDEALLRQLLLNLVDNAIKYTADGGEVSLALRRETSRLRISITDTGAGIPEAEQPHIFERFYRVDKSRVRTGNGNGGGSGLGLSIARWIAEAHEGSLVLQQSDHSGSVFELTLPISNE
ncbi:MAG: ATP-binding protein [Blastocatellia bacterium]|nr:ATP-binding protein [Blastocatellia bacterium]